MACTRLFESSELIEGTRVDIDGNVWDLSTRLSYPMGERFAPFRGLYPRLSDRLAPYSIRRSPEASGLAGSLPTFGYFTVTTVACLLISGCVTAPANVQALEHEWRQRLADNAPAGTPRNEVESLFEQYGLTPATGTYRIRHEDGSETSHCRLPDRVVTARDLSAHGPCR